MKDTEQLFLDLKRWDELPEAGWDDKRYRAIEENQVRPLCEDTRRLDLLEQEIREFIEEMEYRLEHIKEKG